MKKVSIIPHAGLCNRMRAIASGIRIAQSTGAKANVYWNVTPDCRAKFTDLFAELRINDVKLIENQNLMYKTKMRRYFKIPYILQKICYDQVVYDFDKNRRGDIFPLLNYKSALLLYSCYIMCDYDSLSSIFKPSPAVNQKLEKITSSFNSKTVGVHIRGTDHTTAKTQSPLTKFIELMDAEIDKDDTVTFFLATDELTVKQTMIERYGPRILTNHVQLNRDSLEGMIGGVVDLFALSQTSKIIGSYGSSYSEVAAELGNIELVVAHERKN
ncbi:MAG: hypothetical protein IKA86_02955 [Paraprevotella sp.]|nr:hypothetical protein [Paraprevotella sp.]